VNLSSHEEQHTEKQRREDQAVGPWWDHYDQGADGMVETQRVIMKQMTRGQADSDTEPNEKIIFGDHVGDPEDAPCECFAHGVHRGDRGVRRRIMQEGILVIDARRDEMQGHQAPNQRVQRRGRVEQDDSGGEQQEHGHRMSDTQIHTVYNFGRAPQHIKCFHNL